MPWVSNERLDKFNEGFDQCCNRAGNGKVALESSCIRQLVKGDPEAAYRTVELYCAAAQSQPEMLQVATVVAITYKIEMNDSVLMEMVEERAKQLSATDILQSVQVADNHNQVTTEPREREAARNWWRRTGRSDARCDNCSSPMRRGEGYMITGRAYLVGERRVDMGEEIVCQQCFTEIMSEA